MTKDLGDILISYPAVYYFSCSVGGGGVFFGSSFKNLDIRE